MDLHNEAVERLALPIQRLPDAQHPTVVDAELASAVPGCDAEGQLRVGAWWVRSIKVENVTSPC